MHQRRRGPASVGFTRLPRRQIPKQRVPIIATTRISGTIRDQNPLILPPEMAVQHACQRMQKRRVGVVLVTQADGRLLGIFANRDAVCRVVAEGRDARTTTLADVMTRKPDAMSPGETAIDALRLMLDGGFRHVPIVEGGQLVGFVSRGDFRLDEETGLWERV